MLKSALIDGFDQILNIMLNGHPKICEQVRGTLKANDITFVEKQIQNATKFQCDSGVFKAAIVVFNTGKPHVEGADSQLKNWLIQLKNSIIDGSSAPGALLPAEIEKLPLALKQRVPTCDVVVIWFFQESLRCYKAGSYAGSAFMLGAASEKAIMLLIDCYAIRIKDETKRDKFLGRVNGKMVSVRWDEFKRSYKSAKPKPKDLLAQNLDQLLEGAFNFYRYTRNHVGHPSIIPDLEPGVVLANIGQFVTYVERIYGLTAFFLKNDIET